MKNKFKVDYRIVIMLLVVFIIGVVSYGVHYCFFSPSPINKYIASNFYETPANSAFKDDSFYQCVVDAYNKKNNTSLSYTDNLTDEQLKTITSLSCDNKGITDASGVEKLTGLTDLTLYQNQLTSIDVSKNILLEELNVRYNQLTSLDVSKNLSLWTLYASSNQLTSLDVSNNVLLRTLNVSVNQLTSLDVSGLVQLRDLSAYANQITALDVSGFSKLEVLSMDSNELIELNIDGTTALKYLYANGNDLTNLDISDSIELIKLEIANNKLLSLDATNNLKIEKIVTAGNPLESIDVRKNTELLYLGLGGPCNYYSDDGSNTGSSNCGGGNLTTLDVSNNLKLQDLYVEYHQLENLNLSKNTKLSTLKFTNNPLVYLDISGNTELTELNIRRLELETLNASNTAKLENLDVFDSKVVNMNLSGAKSLMKLDLILANQITNLDVSEASSLVELSIYSKQLTSLNVSGAVALETLSLSSNQLTSLDVSTNTSLKNLWVSSNQLASLNVSKNAALESLSVSNNQLTSLDVSTNTSLKKLTLSGNQLASLNVGSNTLLESLNVSSNSLTSLDVSKNLALTSLNVSNNHLANVDVSSNTSLESLNLSNNQLTSLDVSKNTALIELNASNNLFTSFNLVKNTALDGNKVEFLNNCYTVNLSPVLVGDQVNSDGVSNVWLPSHFTPSVSYQLGDGFVLEDDKIIAQKSGTQSYQLNSTSPSYEETYIVEVVDVNSDRYHVDTMKDYIEVGSDTDDVVLDNVNVENGTATIEEDELVIQHEEKEVKRFQLVRMKSSVYDLSKEYLYVEQDTDEEIQNAIETNGEIMIVDQVLQIRYQEELVASYPLVRLETSYDLSKGYLYTLDQDLLDHIKIINGDKRIENHELIISYGEDVLKTIPILSIESELYEIGEEYIYTGFEEFDLDYITKSEEMELFIDDHVLKVTYHEEVLEEIPVYTLRIDSGDIRFHKAEKMIYIKDESTYQDFMRVFVWNVPQESIFQMKLMDGEEVVTEGTVIEGYSLEVLYEDTIIDRYSIELRKEYVEYLEGTSVHVEEYGRDILKYLSIENTFIDVKTLIETDGELSILDQEDHELEEASKVKTGDKFVVAFPSSEYFIQLSVKGDVTGTGKIQEEDVLKGYQILRNEIEVEDYYRFAVDINEDEWIKINDIAKLHQYVKNKIESLEE